MEKIAQFKKYLLEAGLLTFFLATVVSPERYTVIACALAAALVGKAFVDKKKLEDREELEQRMKKFEEDTLKKLQEFHAYNVGKFGEYQSLLNSLSAKENMRQVITNEQKTHKVRSF